MNKSDPTIPSLSIGHTEANVDRAADEMRRVPAVERAGAILDLLSEGGGAPTLSQIARALALPKSSVHGLCRTLCHLGLVRETLGRYSLGPGVLKWAGAFLDGSDLVGEFRAILRTMPDIAAYTVTLSTLEAGEVVYLACSNASAPLGVTFRVGMRLPAAFTATGKAILACLPPGDPALRAPVPKALTPNSVADPAALLGELEEVRRRGFSVDGGQVRVGMICIGAAIRDGRGHPFAGIALSLTEAEATPDAIERLGNRIAEVAAGLAGFAKV